MSRTKNITSKEHCVYCCEMPGWVVYDIGNAGDGSAEQHQLLIDHQAERQHAGLPPVPTYTEAMAPCPHCEMGAAAEKPKTERANTGPYSPPYPKGFWEGRDASGLVPSCRCREKPVRDPDGLERLKELMERMGNSAEFDDRQRARKAAWLARQDGNQ